MPRPKKRKAPAAQNQRSSSATSKKATDPPSQVRSLTLRVDGIPVTATRVQLVDNIVSITRNDTALEHITAPSCHSLTPRNRRTACATVSFRTTLTGDQLAAHLRRAVRGQYPYYFTNNFDGITPLYASDTSDVDIIVVAGLCCHALGSWKSRENDSVWIRDFLPADLPNIRVLLYGYDTALVDSDSTQSIADLGTAFLEQVTAFRAEDETSNRPVILMGHSLGGLVIKEALIRAHTRRKRPDLDLTAACCGLVFFGVPNLGLRHAHLQTLVKGQANQGLINDLLVNDVSEPSNYLKKLNDQFLQSCGDKYPMVIFFERKLSPTLERDNAGNWKRSGPKSLLVREDSASSTGSSGPVDTVPLNLDHSDLVKYDSEYHVHYISVRQRIRDLVQGATEARAVQSIELSFSPGPQQETIANCLRALMFPGMSSRFDNIESVAKNTCEWIFTHPAWIRWLKQNHGLLWIQGHAGTGKSTLLKYAFRQLSAHISETTLILSFFFHSRGHELQKTPIGLFRSMTHQLLESVPTSMDDLLTWHKKILQWRQYNADEKGKDEDSLIDWSLSQLQDFISSSLGTVLKERPIMILVDALDECGQDAAIEIVNFFEDLLERFTTDFQFHICFSCRYYPILRLESGLMIALEEENRHDIRIFVEARLGIKLYADLGALILDQSQGNFLWVRFAVERVLKLKRQGHSLPRIRAEFRKIPPTLQTFYKALVQDGMSENSPTESLRLFQWVCLSQRPLRRSDLQWAMTVATHPEYTSLHEHIEDADFMTLDNIEKRVTTLSCGLIDCSITKPVSEKDDESCDVTRLKPVMVHVIHQSVKDFFLEEGLAMLSDLAVNVVRPCWPIHRAHYDLACVCVQFFKLSVQAAFMTSESEDMSHLMSFFEYAVSMWMLHIEEGYRATDGHATRELPHAVLDMLKGLTTGILNPWVFIRGGSVRAPPAKVLYSFHKKIYNKSEEEILLYFASKNGLEGLLRCVISRLADPRGLINSKDGDGRSPLIAAMETGQENIVLCLSDLPRDWVNVNIRDPLGQTPLMLAVQRGNSEMVRLLTGIKGIDVNAQCPEGKTALSYAVEYGHVSIFKQLLELKTVDINVQDVRGRTPLSLACSGLPGSRNLNIEWLINRPNVEVDLADEVGRTPLFYAVEQNLVTIVRTLLVNGRADANYEDHRGWTPLEFARHVHAQWEMEGWMLEGDYTIWAETREAVEKEGGVDKFVDKDPVDPYVLPGLFSTSLDLFWERESP